MINKIVRMVSKRVYPQALRFAAWKKPLVASIKLLVCECAHKHGAVEIATNQSHGALQRTILGK